MAETLAERLVRLKREQENRGDRIDAVVDSATASGAKPKPKPKPKPKEKTGTGTTSFDLEGAVAKIRKQIAATNDPNLKAKLEARIKALKENQ